MNLDRRDREMFFIAKDAFHRTILHALVEAQEPLGAEELANVTGVAVHLIGRDLEVLHHAGAVHPVSVGCRQGSMPDLFEADEIFWRQDGVPKTLVEIPSEFEGLFRAQGWSSLR